MKGSRDGKSRLKGPGNCHVKSLSSEYDSLAAGVDREAVLRKVTMLSLYWRISKIPG